MRKRLIYLCVGISLFYVEAFSKTEKEINVNVSSSSYTKNKETKKEKRYKRELLKLKDKHVFKSTYSIKVIKGKQLQVAGPAGGSAQALSYAPGVAISSFGFNGSRKASIVLNGIRQGWGGFTGATGIDNGSIGITFDGVPMVNPATGLWESNQIPQLDVIQGIRVIYGPGNPKSRWYNNLGGQIEFIPLQPTKQMGGFVDMSYGSFDTQNIFGAFNTGDIKGWRTVVAFGAGTDHSYIKSADGYNYPSTNYAFYAKTKKVFLNGDGDLSFGVYASRSVYWRERPVPISPIPGITVDRTPNTPLLSQATTGFYTAPNFDVLHKRDENETRIVYSKININLDKNLSLHNLIWYRFGKRLHINYSNYGTTPSGEPGSTSAYEYNNPTTNVYGDKLYMELDKFYHNNIAFGGYFIYTRYNSRNAFWNPAVELAPGVFGSASVPNAKYRSNYWDVTDLAAFLQDRITFDKFSIEPGIRWVDFKTDYSNDTCSDFSLACQLNPSGNEGKLSSTHTDFSHLEPSISLSYELYKGISIYGNYAEAYKIPENGGGGGPYQSVPASELHLEKSQQYQMGVKVLENHIKYGHKIFLGANYFHMLFTHLFFPIYDANGNYLGDGAGDSVYKGVNLFADYYPTRKLYIWTNATFEKANFPNYTFTNANGQVTNAGNLPVSYVPNTLFNLGVSYHYLVNYFGGTIITPSAWFQYVGSQHIFNNLTGLPDNTSMPSYNTLNASLEFEILPTLKLSKQAKLKDVKLTLTALNITNKKYNEFEYISSGGLYGTPNGGYILAYPGMPFTAYVSLRADF